MSHAYDKIQAVRADMNRLLLEREQAVDNALLALLTSQHYIQIGGTGIAKSFLVDCLLARIEGARLFACKCNPGTTDDDLLGPQDMLAYADQGKRLRCHAQSAVEGDVLWLDEIGRANMLVYDILVALLGGERQIKETGMTAPLTLPFISAFAASNSHLIGQWELEALNNRFLLREEIAPITERASFIRLATDPPKVQDIRAKVTLDELRDAQVEAQTVTNSGEVLGAALDLRARLLAEGVQVTPRMWTWSFPLLRAHAWLHGASAMSLEDLGILAHSWWEDPKVRPVVQRAIYAVSNPLDLRALEIEDDAMDALKRIPHQDDPDWLKAAESGHAALKDMVTLLVDEIRASKAREKRQAVRSLVKVDEAQHGLAVQLARRVGSLPLPRLNIAAALAA